MRIKVPFLVFISLGLFTLIAKSEGAEQNDIRWFSDAGNDNLILTATRMGQSRNDSPGKVIVLDRERLLNRGIRTIPEALRLAEEISVIETTAYSQASGHDFRIGFHGGSSLVPRRSQVLVDGMSFYLAGLSKIDWAQMPTGINDIERIEIIPNPAGPSYGANSFQGVINIITRHSADIANHELQASVGSREDGFVWYRYANEIKNTSFMFRLSSNSDKGFDESATTITDGDTAPGSRDDSTIRRMLLRVDSLPTDNTELTIHAGAVHADYEAEYVVVNQESGKFPDLNINDRFLNTKFKRIHNSRSESWIQAYLKRSELKQDFRACSPAVLILPESRAMAVANREYFETLLVGGIPTGGSPEDDALALDLLTKVNELGELAFQEVCGTLNQDYIDSRYHLTFGHHTMITNKLRIVSGATYERLENESETYFDGKVGHNVYSIFSNAEWKLNPHLTFNYGLMIESPENLDETLLSPRLAVNWHLRRNSTFRAVLNRGFRSPDAAEKNRYNWSYFARNITPVIDGVSDSYFARMASSKNFDLKAEKIEAIELGWLYKTNSNNFELDLRFFYEELSDLISEKPFFDDFYLTNSGEGTIQGTAFVFEYAFNSELKLNGGYAYIDHEFNTLNENGLNTNHNGNISLNYSTKKRNLNFGYVGNTSMPNDSFDRWDVTWREKLIQSPLDLEVVANVRYQPGDVVYEEEAINLSSRYYYDDDFYFNLAVKLSY